MEIRGGPLGWSMDPGPWTPVHVLYTSSQDHGEEEAMQIALQHSIENVKVWSCLYITLLVFSWKGNKVKRIFELQDSDDSEDNGTRSTV